MVLAYLKHVLGNLKVRRCGPLRLSPIKVTLPEEIVLVRPDRLSAMLMDAGLFEWLLRHCQTKSNQSAERGKLGISGRKLAPLSERSSAILLEDITAD